MYSHHSVLSRPWSANEPLERGSAGLGRLATDRLYSSMIQQRECSVRLRIGSRCRYCCMYCRYALARLAAFKLPCDSSGGRALESVPTHQTRERDSINVRQRITGPTEGDMGLQERRKSDGQ
jgi:hypothetical protein